MKVKVAFNLNKRTYSIRDYKTNKVVGYSDSIVLRNVSFKVSEAGRQRVIDTKRKNVHAFIVGDQSLLRYSNSGLMPITYNPYKDTGFVWKRSRELIEGNVGVVVCTVKDKLPVVMGG